MLKKLIHKEVIKHPIVVASIGIIAVIGGASLAYYREHSANGQYDYVPVTKGVVSQSVDLNGRVVVPQNPNLAFESAGRVSTLNATVGQKISAGTLLANLDGSALYAQLAQVNATVAAQQAKLDAMKNGARAIDIKTASTSVAIAEQALATTLANVPNVLQDAYGKSSDAVHMNLESAFSNSNTANAALAFIPKTSQEGIDATNGRIRAQNELASWSTELTRVSTTSDISVVNAEIDSALQHLATIKQYSNSVIAALSDATPSQAFPQTTLTTTLTLAGTARTNLNALISSLTTLKETLATQTLSVAQATNGYESVTGGARPEDIAAQSATVDSYKASADAISAQIAKTRIVAPFAGSIVSVSAKQGDIVNAGQTIITLVPDVALEVEGYATEIDLARISRDNSAKISLDAYGTARTFDAKVVSIDESPTIQNGQRAYKVVLQFLSADDAIKNGMTANATIVGTGKSMGLTVPKSAVIRDGNSTYVLVQRRGIPTRTEVTLGMETPDSYEIISGIGENDTVAKFGY